MVSWGFTYAGIIHIAKKFTKIMWVLPPIISFGGTLDILN